jgi:hypothetical protein
MVCRMVNIILSYVTPTPSDKWTASVCVCVCVCASLFSLGPLSKTHTKTQFEDYDSPVGNSAILCGSSMWGRMVYGLWHSTKWWCMVYGMCSVWCVV